MPDIKDIFVDNLKYYLKLRGKTQADLAKYLNVSKPTITNYITGVNLPRMDKVDKICEFLFIRRSDLLEKRKEETNDEEVLLLARDIISLDEEQKAIIKSMIKQFRGR